MAKYCLVSGGEILRGPENVPLEYRDERSGVRISGFNNLPDSELLKYGWMPVSVEEIGRSEYAALIRTDFEIQDSTILQIDTYANRTKEEFEYEQQRLAEAEAQQRQIDGSADRGN